MIDNKSNNITKLLISIGIIDIIILMVGYFFYTKYLQVNPVSSLNKGAITINNNENINQPDKGFNMKIMENKMFSNLEEVKMDKKEIIKGNDDLFFLKK